MIIPFYFLYLGELLPTLKPTLASMNFGNGHIWHIIIFKLKLLNLYKFRDNFIPL